MNFPRRGRLGSAVTASGLVTVPPGGYRKLERGRSRRVSPPRRWEIFPLGNFPHIFTKQIFLRKLVCEKH